MIKRILDFPAGYPADYVAEKRNRLMDEGFVWIKSWADGGMYIIELWLPENDLDQLELSLQKHDWFYQMSDDYGVYCRGSENEKKLLEKAIELGPMGLALFKEYEKKAFAQTS